uniref:Uncharacterized protein n=1 Tax=Amphimedon queenslandica TaxID=400682 RepID=A0A1X7V1W7_AMPQE
MVPLVQATHYIQPLLIYRLMFLEMVWHMLHCLVPIAQKKSKICDNNALSQPCPRKRKVDVDSSTDITSLVLPRLKKTIN